MEITLELVERLKEKASVSYAQAKEALEYSGGNLLDALIYLEEKGAIPREESAYYSTPATGGASAGGAARRWKEKEGLQAPTGKKRERTELFYHSAPLAH